MKPKDQVKELLEQGESRAEIQKKLQQTADNCKSCRQIDTYIADAKAEIEAEQAEIRAEILAARKLRDIRAAEQIPTTAELILLLWQKVCDVNNPVVTGFELRMINNEPHNIARFFSEDFYMKAITKIIEYNSKLDVTEVPDDNEAILSPLTNEQLAKIAEIING